MLFFRRRAAAESAAPSPKAATGEGISRLLRELEESLARAVEHGRTPRVLLCGPPSGTTIETFTRQGCRVTVEGGDAASVPIDQPDNTFDLLLGFDVLDRLDDEQAAPLVAEWARVLAPGGRAYLLARAVHFEGSVAFRGEVLPGARLRLAESRLGGGSVRTRQNRELESLVRPLEVAEILLRRDKLREVLCVKRS